MRNTTHSPHQGHYVSTTIPYVNAPPHVGHALEIVQADTLARLWRLLGTPVWTSTGTDDHSLKNLRAAEALGLGAEELVARNAQAFGELNDALGVHFDQVIPTSREPRHRPSVERLWTACAERGDLYRRRYQVHYCVGCEQFYQLEELIDGVCPEHGTLVEPVEEENWFFRLSRYGSVLERAIRTRELRILPEERERETLAFIGRGLEDFSVSRSAERARGFGIPVPGDPTQVIYVWVDALGNYLTAGDYGALGLTSGWQTASARVQLLGKGVLRFHAVYWPALLLSARLSLPSELRVHGYLTVEGRKIGKSAGNGIDPLALISDYGATALRYYLLRHLPAFKDADFSRGRLIEAHDHELADELGNLAHRVLTLLSRHYGGRLPELGPVTAAEQALEAVARSLRGALDQAATSHQFPAALNAVWQLVRATNQYVDAAQPWHLARRTDAHARQRLDTVLGTAVGALRVLGITLAPFLPELGARLTESVGGSAPVPPLSCTSVFAPARLGGELAPSTVLVPRIASSAKR
jgi:methionyl-tRNA synthetase